MLLELYHRAFAVAGRFLKEANDHDIFSLELIDKLQNMNPSAREMAGTLRKIQSIIAIIADDSYEQQEMSINALQCVEVMKQIADSIERENIDRVKELIKELENLSNNPRPY